MLRSVDAIPVRRNLFAILTHFMRDSRTKQRLVEHAPIIIKEAARMLSAPQSTVDVNDKQEAVTMLSQFTDSFDGLATLREHRYE